MNRVTISMKAARAIHAALGMPSLGMASSPEREELRRAMEPKRNPRKPPTQKGSPFVSGWVKHLQGRPTNTEKRDHRASIREAVVKRAMDAGGLCECGCGEQIRDDRKTPVFPEARGEMDHFWGRGKGRPPESLETCWFLRPACHLAKTRNQPDAATWLERFITHCSKYGYDAELRRAAARRSFVETRFMLGAGLKEREP